MGPTSPAAPLDVATTATYSVSNYGYLSNTGASTYTTPAQTPAVSIKATSGRIVALEFNAISDRRMKENIRDVTENEALKFIEESRPVHFKWKHGEKNDNFGFIAQEVDKLGFHELVSVVPDMNQEQTVDDDGYVSPAGAKFNLNYSQISAILTKAIKMLREKFMAGLGNLDEKVMRLAQENELLKKQNAQIKAQAAKAETETAQIKTEAAQIKTESTRTKARLDLLMKELCEKDQSASFCH